MRKFIPACFFSLLFFLFFAVSGFGASEPSESVPASVETSAVPAAPEKLFYKISLNESFFIREREAVVNTRATVNVLQGEMDKVTLEVFGIGNGQGEIFNVSGEKVKDWSIRRENTRTFLEIRPKDLGKEKQFTLTISGRQPLKLPTTISPLIFSGVDSAAFLGVVQFLASADLRIYAKQERGLIPLGTQTRSQISYSILGTPSVRLDIARANELLAPVSLENFTLFGEVGGNGVRFRMRAKALVREIGAEVPVLTGNAALLNFPEKNDFTVLAKTDEESGETEYRLRFSARGTFDAELLFDAGIREIDGWRQINFCVPVAQVAPYALKGMPADTVFATDNVSIPQIDKTGMFSGFLPSSGALDLRWRPSIPTPPEFSAAVYAIDTASEMQITTGVLKQKNEFDFTISQGELSSLFFDLTGEGDILSVEGQDLLSWTLIPMENGRRGLSVRLSQPKSKNYKLRVTSQTRTGELPRSLSPVRLVPSRTDWEGLPLASVCVRNNELLRLRNGVGVRCEALPHAGMTQVVASAFPQSEDFFESDVPEEQASVYRLASATEKLCVKADFIRSDLIITPRTRWHFADGKITSGQHVTFEVRDAPLYEMQLLVPDDLTPISVDSEIIASHEFADDSGTPGFRLLKIVFSEPLLGEGKFSLSFRKEFPEPGQESVLRACRFPQAHFVFGTVALSSEKNLRLIPVSAENLTEIKATEFSEKNPPQLAFRAHDGNGVLRVLPAERAAELRGVSSCVYKVGREKIFGNLKIDYETDGVPVPQVRLAFPAGAKVLSVSGETVRDWSVGEDGIATVKLSGEAGERFSVSAGFEEPRRESELQAFEGVRLVDAVGDAGTILITADRVLSLEGEESVLTLSPLPLSSAGDDYVRRGGAILFRAYQFVERPFRLCLRTHLLRASEMPKIVVTEARITSNAGQSCDIVYRCRSLGARDLKIGVPEGMKIVCDGAKAQSDGTLLLPLPPNSSEIRLRMESARAEEDFSRERKLVFPQVFAPVVRTVFVGFGDAYSDTMETVVAGRKLNDKLNFGFFVRVFERLADGAFVLVSSFLALAGALYVSSLFERRGNAYRICRGVALIAGTALAVSWVWWLVATVRPDYGETVLVAGLAEPGAVLDVTLHRFYFLGENPIGFSQLALIGIFVVGAALLLHGAGCRDLRLRVVGRVLIYAASAVFSAEDFPYRLPALIAAIIAVEISAYAAFALMRATAKLSEKRCGSGGNAAVLLLAALCVPTAFPSDARAEENFSADFAVEMSGFSEEEEIPHDVADRISQAIDVRGDRIVARGDIRVTGYAGDRFDLIASPAVLTSFEKPEKSMLRLERIRSEDSGYVYQVVLERAGTFSAEFSYELALAENARGFPILSGAAAADVATVHVPRSEVQVSAKGAVTTTLTAWGEKSQIAQIVFKPKAEREVYWNPRERDRSRESVRVFASGENLYVPSAGVIEGRHVMKFVPAQGEVSRVRIRIPSPFSVSRIEGAAVHRWNFNRETGMLTVLFTAPRVSDFSLSVFTQAQLSVLPVRQKFAALEALDCDEQVRTVGIATGDSLQLDAVHVGDLVPVDEDEFNASFAAAGMELEPGLRLRRAFRTVDKAGAFEAELSAVSPNLRITSDEKFFVDRETVRAEINLKATVSRAEIFNIDFRIPAGVSVDVIRGDLLAYWEKMPLDDGASRVRMRLRSALEGEQEFQIWLSGAFPKESREWTLPGFFVENAKMQRGEVSVSVDEGLRLVPESAGRTMPAEASAEGHGDTFCFRYFNRGTESPKFSVLESKPVTNVCWLHKIRPQGRYAFSRVDMVFDVDNVARSSVSVRLPDNALAVRFSGEDLLSAKKSETEPGVSELVFAKPVRGRTSLAAEFFTLLPAENTVRIPRVSVVGADRQTAWLAVERGNVFSNLKSHSPEKVSENDVPEVLRAVLSGGEWFVEKYAEKFPAEAEIFAETVSAWRESFSDVHRDSFCAEELRRYTVFDREKATTEEQITLSAKRSDILRILVPEGGALRSVSVDGNAARVVPLSDTEKSAVWLPIFAKESAPVNVTVVYDHPLNSVQRGERRVHELLPAEIVCANREIWKLLPLDESAETLEVFGIAPETFAAENVAGTPDGEALFLDSGFRDGKAQTYVSENNDASKSRAVFVFPPREKTDGTSGVKIFLILFCVLAAVKIFRFYRSRAA